ncbi:C1 family peptidase [uncultured Tateyamaria sp.]|uniref:C1 family peptidase n=1 Tax=uncultured Tateyamaria sp. TaxID=455651 RepID=UPI0026247C77|nr:C1 family peptidase [uncultured Tateyamaria sp.]
MLLDARPDRMDFRDREYRARLVSQPAQYPSNREMHRFFRQYADGEMILDQGSEGACTGYGLAAVVNYLNWIKWLKGHHDAGLDLAAENLPNRPACVSAWMLYSVAQLYDEWEGEDYSGSSCRGAMKGWHKHGVCSDALWATSTANAVPNAEWLRDAASNPLGAYYRVNAMSITDMQSAIYEVGAIYCSAKVHAGWNFDTMTATPETQNFDYADPDGGAARRMSLPVMPVSGDRTGGHAFCIVGYTDQGFIVQNSWGGAWAKSWGAAQTPIANAVGGFALMTYEDWVINGHDAWVAALAAPVRVSNLDQVTPARSRHSLLEKMSLTGAQRKLELGIDPDAPRPWSEQKAYEHSIVMGNNGKLVRRRVDMKDGPTELRTTIGGILEASAGRDVVIYAHGGLNSEEVAIKRAQVLGPWFEANNITPIFVIWRTGFIEAVANIGEDMLDQYRAEQERIERTGLVNIAAAARRKLNKSFDIAFEAIAEKVLGKAVWSQIKQNAEAACQVNSAEGITGGMRILANVIRDVQKKVDNPVRIHLLGHSAGAIILGHFAQDLARFSPIGSLGLLAPACTLSFANRMFKPLVETGSLPRDKFYVVNLSRSNERADRVGLYHKSLLYLVSRALESPRKSPLLGLDDSWILPSEVAEGEDTYPKIDKAVLDDPAAHARQIFDELQYFYALAGKKDASTISEVQKTKLRGVQDILQWRAFKARSEFPYRIVQAPQVKVREATNDDGFLPTAHGTVDNDLTVMNWAIFHIAGATPHPIKDLSGV